jgi:hypothetical protein
MRKAKPKKRVILPDPVFNDQKVSKFVNHLMYDGKKNTTYEIFYNALKTVETKLPGEETSAFCLIFNCYIFVSYCFYNPCRNTTFRAAKLQITF